MNNLNKLFFQRKNTKGSHVGIVLSFTIFITFLVFTYAILGPIIVKDGERGNSLNELENLIKEEISKNVFSIRLYDSSSAGGCISIDKPSNNFENESFIVLNSSETELNSAIESTKLLIESGNNFIKGYFSEDIFEDTNASLSGCTATNYDSILNETKIVEKKILEIIYQSVYNYSSFQEKLGVNYEFEILFDYKNGTIIGERKGDIKEDIFAKTLNIEYLDLKAKKKIGDIILRIW
ncbi:MAG: hypothetical protein U9Q99_01900 [Nanoarchaeota archaeon]|nr:hypothetical protein [Nanoarchaeota archaeon]